MESAADLVSLLSDHGLTIATAESLTGGLLAAAITAVPGSSQVYGGGVVSYAPAVKVSVLGVPESVVDEHGVISAECAMAMAERVRRLVGAEIGLSTTGVAGPDRQEDKPVGTVFVGLADAAGSRAVPLSLGGDRGEIQHRTVREAVSAAYGRVSRDTEEPGLG